MNKYPVITALMRHGGLFSAVVAAAVAILGIYVGVAGGGVLWIGGGLIGGAVTYVLLKSYVELVAILSDMLMPR